MMSEVVERVARALERRRHPEWNDAVFETWWIEDLFFGKQVTTWPNGFCGTRKERCLDEARAAIEAMKVPTFEMSLAGLMAHDDCGHMGGCSPERIWSAMITEALK